MEQPERINLIEKFMHKHWQIALAGWGSGYGQATKVLSDILFALVNHQEITVGYGPNDQIPIKSTNRVDYAMLDELRAANITLDDLKKVKHNREVNGALAIELATEILERGFNDFRHIEHVIWKAINNQPTNYLSAESVQRAKAANFIHLDFSGFLSFSRIRAIASLIDETDLTPKKIISMVINIGEHACDKLSANIESQKKIIEDDFNRLKHHNVTATETIQDMLRIGQDLPSHYSHIRDPQLLIRAPMDARLVGYVAAKLIPILNSRYAFEKLHPPPAPEPIVVRNKTAEEIAEEKSIQENGFANLIAHFNLTAADAMRLVSIALLTDLQSLWHIKINIMPRVEPVLYELTDMFHGNIQMVEDIVEFEQLMWLNATESFRKYHVPVQRLKFGVNPVSVISNVQSETLLLLKKYMTPALIKPLRNNLTETYQRNHPNETIVIGRDIRKFKEYTYMYSWKSMPEFMFNNSDVIAVINSTEPETYPYIPKSRSTISVEDEFNNYLDNMDSMQVARGEDASANLLLTMDLVILGIVLAMIFCYRPVNYACSLFSAKKSKPHTKNEPVLTEANSHDKEADEAQHLLKLL